MAKEEVVLEFEEFKSEHSFSIIGSIPIMRWILIIVPILFLIYNFTWLLIPVRVKDNMLLDRPEVGYYVNDDAWIFNESEEVINSMSASLYEDYGIEFYMISVTALKGTEIEDYSDALWNKWELSDDSIFILIAPNDRQVRIEIGSNIESDGIYTSEDAEYEIDDILAYFTNGYYEAGMIMSYIDIYKFFDEDMWLNHSSEASELRQYAADRSTVYNDNVSVSCATINGVYECTTREGQNFHIISSILTFIGGIWLAISLFGGTTIYYYDSLGRKRRYYDRRRRKHSSGGGSSSGSSRGGSTSRGSSGGGRGGASGRW